jgi:hypothetical protein
MGGIFDSLSTVIAAAAPHTIVIEKGGNPTWLPFVTAGFGALAGSISGGSRTREARR